MRDEKTGEISERRLPDGALEFLMFYDICIIYICIYVYLYERISIYY